jgi:signal transduction histidine kinase
VVRGALAIAHAQIQEKKVKLQVELAKDLPPLTLDVANMKRAILQLLANALEAMTTRGVLKLRTAVREDFVELEVADNGKGIPAAILPHIFDTFFSPSLAVPAWVCPLSKKSFPNTVARYPLRVRKKSALR